MISTDILVALIEASRISGVEFAVEHQAVHMDPMCQQNLFQSGFLEVGKNGGGTLYTTFNRQMRIEVTSSEDIPPHWGFAVRDEDDLGPFMSQIWSNPDFEHCDDLSVGRPGEIHSHMFKYKPTEEHIQLLWRTKQIFEGVFPEKRKKSDVEAAIDEALRD